MIRKSHNGIQWLEFELFQEFPKVKHAIFLRHGGVSTGQYASLNLNYNVGDDAHHVTTNLNRIKELLEDARLCWSSQVHGKKVLKVGTDWQNGKLEGDALITCEINTGLMIHHADCQAAIFYDPIHHVAANVHCGWRGSVQNIYSATVHQMHLNYGTQPEDLFVGISPSLGPNSSEFINYATELPESFSNYLIKPFYFDFWAISRDQLIKGGILPHHIQMAEMDTFALPQDFYSHRYSKIRGGNATVVYLT